MNKSARRSGVGLMAAGLLCGLFFWLTDPRLGVWSRVGAWENPIDAANQALVGTMLGLAGAAAFIAIGVWLLTRRET